jgi:hypothetical protein
MGIKHSTTVVGSNDPADQVSVNAWNADHVVDSSGLTLPTNTAAPSTPAADTATLFMKNMGGKSLLATVDQYGSVDYMQPHWAFNTQFNWRPSFGTTTISSWPAVGFAVSGTATAATFATTSLHTRTPRVDYLVTTPSISAVAGAYLAQPIYSPSKGVHAVLRTAPATGTTISTQRFFTGLGPSSAPTDVNPSTLTNIAGFGYDASDTNWQAIYNDASGAASKINTGIARPSADRTGPYMVSVYISPGGASMSMTFLDEATGVTYNTPTITSDITTSTGMLFYHSVGGTSSATGITLFSLYAQTNL